MSKFSLHPQLAKDCFVLGRLEQSQLLLLNNTLVPWFILVPETDVKEIYQLQAEQQQSLLSALNLLSVFITSHFHSEKLNVAAIGNKVSQLHIHVIGRSPSDYCWPGVVWADSRISRYDDKQLAQVRRAVEKQLPGLDADCFQSPV